MGAANNIETERRFLLANDGWKAGITGTIEMRAGYINNDPRNSTVVRIEGYKAFIDISGPEGTFSIAAPLFKAIKIQTLLKEQPNAAVRVRTENDQAFLIFKGKEKDDDPLSRPELDVPLDFGLANTLLEKLCNPDQIVTKTRHLVPMNDMLWEVDIFHGRNKGLEIAEIEIPNKDTPVALPDWVGLEISLDKRYSNLALSRNPIETWGSEAGNFSAAASRRGNGPGLKPAA